MLFSGHALDEKAFPGNWPKAAATPERLFRARDVGMLGISPPKRYEPTRLDPTIRMSTELGMQAELYSRGRMSPTRTEWSAPRTGATSFASSVTSLSSPRNLEMNDSAVELMVKTIEDQEQEIQASRKQIMIKMRAVEKLSREEEKLREFLDRCSNATRDMWAENGRKQEANNVLKAKLNALLEMAKMSTTGAQDRA